MRSIDRSRPAAAQTTDGGVALANGGQGAARRVVEGIDRLPAGMRRLLQVLDADYGYKPDHFVHRVTVLALPVAAGKRSLNALSFDASPEFPFLLAVASPDSFDATHRDAAIRYALDTVTINVVLLYDLASDHREVFRRNHREDRFEPTSGLPPYLLREGRQPSLFNAKTAAKDNTEQRSQLPITNKLEDIFFEMHSTMRDEDGLHADEALEELCKLLHLKTSIEANGRHLETITPRSIEERSALLRGLFLQSCQMDSPVSTTASLPFSKPIRLSTKALVKAFGLLDGYTLSGTHTDIKGRAFQKVLTKAARAGMGQYFTPAPVVSMMVDIVEPDPSEYVVDPFCGSGHFLKQTIFRLKKISGELPCLARAGNQLHGIEKSERMASVAITELLLNGCPRNNIRTADALMDFDSYDDIHPESFDVVLTNPPFGSILGVQAFSSLAKFNLAKGRKRLPLEVAGLERCAELLRPGGRLAIVLPESIFGATSLKYVRTWLYHVFAIRIVVDLPPETFCPFGANVRSGVLFARKRRCGEQLDSDQKVNMIRVDNVGYDASGRAKAGADIDLAVNEARRFLAAEGW